MSTNTRPKLFVFVLMPFKHEFDDIYILGIKAACEAAGTYCERVDEQIYQGRVLDRIHNQIAKADIVVSDMSERNPNVFYETGYAHALGKQVILLTQDANDIPFDLKDFPHVVYGKSILTLKTELEKRVRWYVDNPGGPLASVDFGLAVYINGVPYQCDSVLELHWLGYFGSRLGIEDLGPDRWRRFPDWVKETPEECRFAVSFHNATERPQECFCRVKVETPPWMRLWQDSTKEKKELVPLVLPSGNLLFDWDNVDIRLLPDEWIPLSPGDLGFLPYGVPSSPQNVLILHIYTELGRKEFPVKFWLIEVPTTEDSKASS